jgi:RNA polymerase sigma-70 factor (ECF subfamily)
VHALPVTRSRAGPSDAALVVAARAAERWAAEALYRRYAEMANGLALRLIGRDSDVDDLVQDSFVEALSGLDRLREPEAFAGWLRAIIVHRATKWMRRRRLFRRLGIAGQNLAIDPDSLIAASAPADLATELRRIYSVIESLPAQLRIPLVLRRVEGLSLDEIAELTKTSLATVKRRIADADRVLQAKRSGESS